METVGCLGNNYSYRAWSLHFVSRNDSLGLGAGKGKVAELAHQESYALHHNHYWGYMLGATDRTVSLRIKSHLLTLHQQEKCCFGSLLCHSMLTESVTECKNKDFRKPSLSISLLATSKQNKTAQAERKTASTLSTAHQYKCWQK